MTMDKGREYYVIGKALYVAIETLDRLPDDRRPVSDIDDMAELLMLRYKDILDILNEEERLPLPVPLLRLVQPNTPPEEP